MEWPADFKWNQWPDSRGMGGRFRMESVAGLDWNTQKSDLERITKSFENSTTREQLNRTIELCSPLYKKYGDGWMKELEKKLLVNGKEEFVKRFIQFVKRKSMDIIHLKEMKKEQKKQSKSKKVSK